MSDLLNFNYQKIAIVIGDTINTKRRGKAVEVTHIHRGQTFSLKLHLLFIEHFPAICKNYLECALIDSCFQQIRRLYFDTYQYMN